MCDSRVEIIDCKGIGVDMPRVRVELLGMADIQTPAALCELFSAVYDAIEERYGQLLLPLQRREAKRKGAKTHDKMGT